MKKIILASSSPQRQELFQKFGFEFWVVPSNFDESSLTIGDPERLVKALALAKAKRVAEVNEDAVVVGADTVVVLGDQVYGKPRDREHAKEMLTKLSGSTHSVITGIAVYDADTHSFITDSAETKLSFLPVSDLEIDAYVRSGEPFGKAGGYAIQGLGAFLVKEIEGDYENVAGLPLGRLARHLENFGIYCGGEAK